MHPTDSLPSLRDQVAETLAGRLKRCGEDACIWNRRHVVDPAERPCSRRRRRLPPLAQEGDGAARGLAALAESALEPGALAL